MFKRNHFIHVSTNHPHFPQHVANHGAAIWKHKIAQFPDYAMTITMLVQSYNAAKQFTTFLMCATDLPILIGVLEMIILAEQPGFEFSFELQPGVNPKVTLALLAPFKRMRGEGQDCVIRGCLDAKLHQAIETSMTPRVFWSRLRSRHFYLWFWRIQHRLRCYARKQLGAGLHHLHRYQELLVDC